MSRLRWRKLVLALLAPTLLVPIACDNGGDPPQPSPSPTPLGRPSGTPSSSPSASSTTDPSGVEAEAALIGFWNMLDRLSSEPKSSLTEIFTVARGEVADQYIQDINRYRAEGVHQVGTVALRNLRTKRHGKPNRYQVRACVDVSSTDLVDREGASVLPKNAPTRTESKYELEEDAGRWYVVNETAESTC